MPPRGWRSLSLREETLRLLKEIQEREQLATLDDTVRLLLERARLCSELEPRLRKIELLLLRLLEELAGEGGEGPESPRATGADDKGLSRSVRTEPTTDPGPAGREPENKDTRETPT